MKEANTGTAELCLVEVPEGACRIKLNRQLNTIGYWLKGIRERVRFHTEKLVIADYTLLGLCPDISEEDAAKVVDAVFGYYPDYMSIECLKNRLDSYFLPTAIASLRSLITSLGMDWDRTVVMVKN